MSLPIPFSIGKPVNFQALNFRATAVCLAVAATCLLTLSACKDNAAAPPEPTEAILQGDQLMFPQGHPQLRLIKLAKAVPTEAVDLPMSAKLSWDEARTQRIYPAFAGRVERISADLGQKVSAGAVLAEIASPDFGQAQADAARAHADATLARKQLNRQKELLDAGLVARRDFEQNESDAARAEAELARAEARVKLYGGNANVNQRLSLRASVSGVVVDRNINPGQELRPDQSGPGVPPVFVISDPTRLWVLLDEREADAGVLHVGARFSLELPAWPGRRFEGRVTALADTIDPGSRTIKVRGEIDNHDRLLKAEMLATAHVQRSLGGGVTVPAQAIVLRGERHWVYVQTQANAFAAREVKLSYNGPHVAVVAQGLKAGDMVVSENALLLASQFRMAQDEAKPEAAPPTSAGSATEAKRP
ncbi:efflux RND transporter periplasmic adaptor subunit [Roseateles koreensis]|uniref:Efflux RND transporter periplasmic adaptor subunit n=1 Tax=Roseateles koreensis TaxID=2987526 RepID=A0ABT5KRD4_9BURK|nr:efflux RND transporter periplasmic adaptor subunit [Roseateles koreensis]MDC8785005.1 efflux RND transporter periplasmic adaptor subunit [Roseateles koreensis]